MTLTRHDFTMLDMQMHHYYYGHSNTTPAVKLNTSSGFVKSEVAAVRKQIEQLTATDTLAADDKVFFTPFSKVPRYKFNEYAKDKPKLSRTITLSKATAVVLNPEGIMEGLRLPHYCSHYKKVKVSDLKDIYQHIDQPTILAIKQLENVYFHDQYLSTFKKLEPNFQGKIADEEVYVMWSNYADGAIAEAVAGINDILSINGTKKIISDQTMLGEINQGTVITPEMFDELSSMLGSTDNDVIGLAMEVMANSDYKSSELKILTLLNRFYHMKMQRHKNCGLVNFRSLIEYFNRYDWQGTVVNFCNSLVENAVPTADDYDERIDMVKRNMLSYVNDILAGSKFSVKDVLVDTPIVTTDTSQSEVSHSFEVT